MKKVFMYLIFFAICFLLVFLMQPAYKVNWRQVLVLGILAPSAVLSFIFAARKTPEAMLKVMHGVGKYVAEFKKGVKEGEKSDPNGEKNIYIKTKS